MTYYPSKKVQMNCLSYFGAFWTELRYIAFLHLGMMIIKIQCVLKRKVSCNTTDNVCRSDRYIQVRITNLLLMVRKQNELFVLLTNQRLHSIPHRLVSWFRAELRFRDKHWVKETYGLFTFFALRHHVPMYKKDKSHHVLNRTKLFECENYVYGTNNTKHLMMEASTILKL